MDAVQGACGDQGACGLIGHMVLESGAGACVLVLGHVVKGQHVLALEYYIVLPQSLWRQYLDVVQSLGGWLVGYLWGYKSQGLESSEGSVRVRETPTAETKTGCEIKGGKVH